MRQARRRNSNLGEVGLGLCAAPNACREPCTPDVAFTVLISRKTGSIALAGAGGHGSGADAFQLPALQRAYHVVRAQAGPETVGRELTCRACRGLLPSRDGKHVLKFLLLRKVARHEPPARLARNKLPNKRD